MCGINGFIGTNESVMANMNAALMHRGPDYAGGFHDGRLSLSHVLLSIRDASDVSRQPVHKPGSPWILAFNGQLYNTRELKVFLGSEFENVDLDTTLLYAAIEREGWNFVRRIHGMYAIVLYNTEEGIVRLYRDPSGQKLLYYYAKDGRFIWSSELKGILAHPGIDRAPDEEAVAIAASLGYIPGVKTLFKHIRKLNLSQRVSFDLRTKTLSSEYFSESSHDYFPENPDEAFKLLIEEHLQSKQPVAINLSGGLDSSLLVHEMAKLGHEIHTYTTRFADCDAKFNLDADLAARLANDYHTKHTEVLVTKETFFQNFLEAYRLIEEPNYNVSLPAYLQIAKREGAHGDRNRVILSGDGGDELFAGYPHYKESRRIDRMQLLMTPWLFNLLKNRHSRLKYRYDRLDDRWLALRAFTKRFLHGSTSGLAGYVHETVAPYLETYGANGDSVYQMMVRDRVLWMGGENFIRSDKLFMSQSLELRSPLAYHPFRLRWDTRLKPKDYVGKNIVNKPFLRAHYLGKLPDYITKREDKTGWRSPIQEWYDVRYRDMFLDTISVVENNNGLVDWKAAKEIIMKRQDWPGKTAHLYVSLALLAKEYRISI